jgi:hypothetical protein
MNPIELLGAAQRLLERPGAHTAGLWPRAAALLGRQALEHGLDAYWRARGVSLDKLATRPQLICLSRYLNDESVAGRISHAWSALTSACHHHAYELRATHAEVGGWLDAVAEALAAMQAGDAR